DVAGSGTARAGQPVTQRRGLSHLQSSPGKRYARRTAAARSLGEPRGAHRAYPYATFSAVECAQGRTARVSRCKFLEADCLRLIARSAFWRSEVVAWAGADFHLIVNVLHGPDGRGHQVNIAVAVFFAGGGLRDAGLRGKRKRAGRGDLRPGIFRFGL